MLVEDFKNGALHIAETIDSWRVFPRLVLCGYAWYVWSVTFFILRWYSEQAAVARGVEESAVVGVVITAVTGFSPWIMKIYVESGRNWNQTPSTQDTLVVEKKTTVTQQTPA